MRENNSHREAAFQSRLGGSHILCLRGCIPFSVSNFCRDWYEGAHGSEIKLLVIFFSPRSRWKAGRRREKTRSQSWSESTAQLLLDCNSNTDFPLYSVTSMHEINVRLLKLEKAEDARRDEINILKGDERILLMEEVLWRYLIVTIGKKRTLLWGLTRS